jgi:hypothetical protein
VRVLLRRPAAPTRAASRSVVRATLDSPGQALPPAARAYFEPRFAHDFSRVRIHTEPAAAEAARAVGAIAFTVGNDIVFGAGRYSMDRAGSRLLAHELVHVVQQNGATALHRRPIDDGASPPVAEDERKATVTKQTLPFSISLPGVFGIAKDVAPEEAQEPSIAAARDTTAGSVDDLLVVPRDHPSEREADAVSESILSGEVRGPGAITNGGPMLGRVIQRQVYWDDRTNGALTWTDYSGSAPVKDPKVPETQWDSVTVWGFSPMSATASATMTPFPADKPEACVDTKGNKTTKFQATARYEPTSLHVRALMMPAQSWVRATTKTASLLAHEQGHFDVTHVMAGKVEKCLLDLASSSTASEVGCGRETAVGAAAASLGRQPTGDVMQNVWNAGHTLATTIQTDYDTQTNHSRNARKQTEWLGAIAAGLTAYPMRCPTPAAAAPAAPPASAAPQGTARPASK